MTGGYTGKILRLNLTNLTASTMDTSKYEEYGGGIGMGTAIFWELAADKLPMDAFDPSNVVTMFTGPLAGTIAHGASRLEMNAIGPKAYPIGWFARGNMGGRFAAEMKYAGWDGIVIEGKASNPVWVNVIDDKVTFEDATGLWGKDTWVTQQDIWVKVTGNTEMGKEWCISNNCYTTQRPAVACIGPIGEAMCRDLGVVMHDASNAVGQGGFGAVWGSKNLKAISVVGNGSVPIADPKALVDARMWSRQFVDNPDIGHDGPTVLERPGGSERGPHVQGMRGPGGTNTKYGDRRIGPQSCMSCPYACRMRFDTILGNEAHCATPNVHNTYLSQTYKDPNILQLKNQEAAAIVNKWGVDVFTIRSTIPWLVSLYEKGILGPGKEINTDLPFELIGHPGWLEMLFQKIVAGEDIGLDLREGNMRAAEKWGRLEPDLKSGDLNCPWWGYSEHENSRIQADWSFYSMVADRDCNEHGITNVVGRYPRYGYAAEGLKTVPLDDCVRIMSEKLIPFEGDPMMVDGSTEARYSVHMAKMVAWQAYYSRFWKQGINYCDWGWPDFVNVSAPDYDGYTPEGEPRYYNAITGKNLTFRQGMEIGRKVWNWQNAIWVLQGRHRDIVKFAAFVYEVPNPASHYLLGYDQDKEQWVWEDYGGHTVDRQKFEEWKTKYYEVMDWDTATGWPNRKTLEEVGLGFVADKLEEKGKLGS